jgi:hypothetical protein
LSGQGDVPGTWPQVDRIKYHFELRVVAAFKLIEAHRGGLIEAAGTKFQVSLRQRK